MGASNGQLKEVAKLWPFQTPVTLVALNILIISYGTVEEDLAKTII